MDNPEALAHLRHQSVSDEHCHPEVPQQLKATRYRHARPDMLTLADPMNLDIPVVR